jgi:hypothetical protein
MQGEQDAVILNDAAGRQRGNPCRLFVVVSATVGRGSYWSGRAQRTSRLAGKKGEPAGHITPTQGQKGSRATAHADELRARAELFRRAAAHPTEGGKKTDRILLAEAERLARNAAQNEERNASPASRNR